MTLVALLGEFGSGKTLSLTYLGYHNFLKGRRIFANYHLFKPLEYTHIETLEDIDKIKEGVFLADELWFWLDARSSLKKINKELTRIVSKGRKREVDLIYTAQTYRQIDVRLREWTDFIILPKLGKFERICKLYWYYKDDFAFRGWNAPAIKIVKYLTAPVMEMYDHTEEIKVME